ncbi:MAG: hypothetical protein ABIS21_01640 [Acidimicrobiales bacterium]
MVILPLAGALLASMCFGTASVLQHVSASRAAAGRGVDPRLLLRLARQGPYLIGLGLDAAGFVVSAWALRRLPLFVVQAALASSLAITAGVAAATVRESLLARERRAIAGIIAGLVLLAVAASPEPASPGRSAGTLLLGGLVALLVAAVLVDRRAGAAWSGVAFGALSGLAFGGFGLASRVLGSGPGPPLVGDPLAWAMVGYVGLGLLFFAAALQRGKVTAVTAACVVTETLVPAVLGVLFLGDGARPGLGAVALVGFALSCGAAVSLARPSPGSLIGQAGDPAELPSEKCAEVSVSG